MRNSTIIGTGAVARSEVLLNKDIYTKFLGKADITNGPVSIKRIEKSTGMKARARIGSGENQYTLAWDATIRALTFAELIEDTPGEYGPGDLNLGDLIDGILFYSTGSHTKPYINMAAKLQDNLRLSGNIFVSDNDVACTGRFPRMLFIDTFV